MRANPDGFGNVQEATASIAAYTMATGRNDAFNQAMIEFLGLHMPA